MGFPQHRLQLSLSLLLAPACLALPTQAQIQPDTTLPQPSQVTIQDQTQVIEAGTQVGGNLFHSFETFSIPTGSEVMFNPAPSVDRIISRVTGESPSLIDGTLRVGGVADLFLLNPNGLILGPNAQLDLGGSLIGSTADSLNFADGSQFSARDPGVAPLLTVSLPTGLQFNGDPGPIQVQGPGHEFFYVVGSGVAPPPQLQVPAGETFALVGGELTMTGGLITAPGGRIEVGAVGAGQVQIQPQAQGWRFSYGEVQSFQEVQLSAQSLLNAGGTGALGGALGEVGGSIQIQADDIGFSEFSLALVQGLTFADPERITVDAAGTLDIRDGVQIFLPDGALFLATSGVLTENYGPDPGGVLQIRAEQLVMEEEGAISSVGLASGQGADIVVEASESIQMRGSEFGQTTINAQAFGSEDTGSITVTTEELVLIDGGAIGSQTAGAGDSGDVTIVADSIQARGIVEALEFVGSALSAGTAGVGNGGDLFIETDRLLLQDGGVVTASTFNAGSAGTVTIQATESVRVEGSAPLVPSQIASSAFQVNPLTGELLQLPPDLVPGEPGRVEILTPRLEVVDGGLVAVLRDGPTDAGDLTVIADLIHLDGGQISVDQTGIGAAGNLSLTADRLKLTGGSSVNATSPDGQAGNIFITVNDLELDQLSRISTTAAGTGDGGNINITADVVVATPRGNSDILANAVVGAGGQILISAEAILGFEVVTRAELEAELGPDLSEFDPANLPSNDIIAISQTDPTLNGEVILDSPDVDPAQGALVVPSDLVSLEELIASTCAPQSQQSNFLITGRGGVVPDPTQPLDPGDIWVDLRALVTSESPPEPSSEPISQDPLQPDSGLPEVGLPSPTGVALQIQCPKTTRISSDLSPQGSDHSAD